jgi:ferredoxin-type protein NapH
VQLGVIALFVLGYRLDWKLFGVELIQGDLSASRLLDAVPLADPFAVLQIGATGHAPALDLVLGALIVAGFYLLVGGRAFCAWVCPMNVVADAAETARGWLRVPGALPINRCIRVGALVMALLLSPLAGVAAFEWVSPIGMLQRGLIYGLGLGWVAAAGIFVFDWALLRHGWCGHLCPLGAFYGLLGWLSPLRVAFAPETCTRCGECVKVCPEPQVLNLVRLADTRLVRSGDCSNCGSCIAVCPEDSLRFSLGGWRPGPRALAGGPSVPTGGTAARRAS